MAHSTQSSCLAKRPSWNQPGVGRWLPLMGILFGVFASASGSSGVSCDAWCESATDRPNVVLIVADDLGWADIEPNNPETFYRTPNLNRLAARGVRFTNAYAAAPVCSPTRGSIMTGRPTGAAA